jgi:hypothetical protein
MLNNTLNGSVTTLGHTLRKFRSVELLDALAIIMSQYISPECKVEIIKLVAICEIAEGKLDSLFEYKNNEKGRFIKEMSNYSIDGSDHLTILNVYNNYYKKDMMQWLSKKKFKKIDEIIIELTKYADSIKPEKYEYINMKYNIIQDKKLKNINDMILYVLQNANKFNLLEKNKNEYNAINYLDKVKAPLEFSLITNDNNNGRYAVCGEYNIVFGKTHFNTISLL